MLFSPSPDWMWPTHIMKGNLLYSKPTDLTVTLIQKHPHRTSQTNVSLHSCAPSLNQVDPANYPSQEVRQINLKCTHRFMAPPPRHKQRTHYTVCQGPLVYQLLLVTLCCGETLPRTTDGGPETLCVTPRLAAKPKQKQLNVSYDETSNKKSGWLMLRWVTCVCGDGLPNAP